MNYANEKFFFFFCIILKKIHLHSSARGSICFDNVQCDSKEYKLEKNEPAMHFRS